MSDHLQNQETGINIAPKPETPTNHDTLQEVKQLIKDKAKMNAVLRWTKAVLEKMAQRGHTVGKDAEDYIQNALKNLVERAQKEKEQPIQLEAYLRTAILNGIRDALHSNAQRENPYGALSEYDAEISQILADILMDIPSPESPEDIAIKAEKTTHENKGVERIIKLFENPETYEKEIDIIFEKELRRLSPEAREQSRKKIARDFLNLFLANFVKMPFEQRVPQLIRYDADLIGYSDMSPKDQKRLRDRLDQQLSRFRNTIVLSQLASYFTEESNEM